MTKTDRENDDVNETACSTALKKLKRKVPYGWDLNIYRGCQHGCAYCYANNADPGRGEVTVKANIVELLDKELSEPTWNREVVNIGGVTDSYQQPEAEQKIMPEVLKTFIKHKTPVIICTKSDLILRDYELIAELARITYVNVATSITTMDEQVRRHLEPRASSGQARFAMLKEFRKTNASVGVHAMPIIPYLTDSYTNIGHLCAEAKAANVHYMMAGVLYLRGTARKNFFEFIGRSYPDIYDSLTQLYKRGGAGKVYKEKLYSEIVNPLRQRYGLSNSYIRPMRDKMHKQ